MQLIKNKYDFVCFETLHDLFNDAMSIPEEAILCFDVQTEENINVISYFLFDSVGDVILMMRNNLIDTL